MNFEVVGLTKPDHDVLPVLHAKIVQSDDSGQALREVPEENCSSPLERSRGGMRQVSKALSLVSWSDLVTA